MTKTFKTILGLILAWALTAQASTVIAQSPNITSMHTAATTTANGTALVVSGAAGNPANTIGAAGVQIANSAGTFTITFETLTSGSTWTAVMATNMTDDVRATTATAAGQYTILLGGAVQLRARISACSGCNVTVVGRLVPGLVARVASGGGGVPGSGTVTSVGWTGGIVSVATATTTPAFTIAGTSGGIPFFDSATSWASSAALAANSLVKGGGAGVAPSTITTGTGVLTALGVNTGSAGAFIVNGGALGTPSSGTLTSATGLPISTGVSGLGTGVATALAVANNSAGGYSPIDGTATLTNKTISGASNTLSNIGNSSLTNSAITINAGTNFGITAPGSSSLGATVTIGATTDNLRFANLGLGVAASTSGGQIASTLGANNITGLLIKRNTDTTPTGKFFDFQNAAGTSVASMDIAGALTVTSCTGCGGSSGITIGTTTITSGTNTKVLFNNAGVVGEYTVTGSGNAVLSASPTLTGTVGMAAQTNTGTIVQASASATAFASGASSATPSFLVDNSTSSQVSGMKVIGKADGTAPELKTISRTQITSALAGNGLSITADSAVAGSSTAGAAAGGSVTITAGSAAQLTSGVADGGNILLTPGAAIGGGNNGWVKIADARVLRFDTGAATVPYGFFFNSASDAGRVQILGGGSEVAAIQSVGIGIGNTGSLTAGTSFIKNNSDIRLTRDSTGLWKIVGGIPGVSTAAAGIKAIADANGSFATEFSSTEQLTLNTGSTTTTTAGNLAPANTRIKAILIRVTTTITTAANFNIKVTGGNVFSMIGTATTSLTTLTAGTTYVLVPSAYADQYNTSATTLTVTTNANPGAGVLRITVIYEQFSPPTS